MDLRPHSGKIVGFAIAVTALSLSFGGWALASHSSHDKAGQNITVPTFNSTATPVQGSPDEGTQYGDEFYKVENGVVYEWDDGWWKPKPKKKIENGIVYEWDDARWEVEYDPSTYNAKPQGNKASPHLAPQTQSQNNGASQNNTRPNSKYKVENNVVYEWDDGKWEPEYDKKSENGVIYEYDDGRWEVDDDNWDDDWGD